MYYQYTKKLTLHRAIQDRAGESKPCGSQPYAFYCTLYPNHPSTHLAGLNSRGEVIAEWDDDRSTDGDM